MAKHEQRPDLISGDVVQQRATGNLARCAQLRLPNAYFQSPHQRHKCGVGQGQWNPIRTTVQRLAAHDLIGLCESQDIDRRMPTNAMAQLDLTAKSGAAGSEGRSGPLDPLQAQKNQREKKKRDRSAFSQARSGADKTFFSSTQKCFLDADGWKGGKVSPRMRRSSSGPTKREKAKTTS